MRWRTARTRGCVLLAMALALRGASFPAARAAEAALPPPAPHAGGPLPAPMAALPMALAAATSSRGQEPLMICRNLTKGNVLASRVVLATTMAARRTGLLGRSSLAADEGMLLIPCSAVHTIGMKFAIDVVFLDKQCSVVEVRPDIAPGALLVSCRKARSTLELAAGVAAARRLEAGDRLLVTRARAAEPNTD